MRIEIELRNADRLMRKLAALETRTRAEARRFVVRGRQMLYDTARTYTSLTDHSLADLARLGNPYARRWAPGALHADYLVHIQQGTLTASLYQGGPVETETEIVGWVANSAYYDLYLQLGTVKMRPRPYMAQTRADLEPAIRDMARQMLHDIVQTVVTGPSGATA